MQQTELFILKKNQIREMQMAKFVSFLKGRDWIGSKQIKQAIGLNERTARSLAEHSDGEIISSQRGYKLIYDATADEVSHSINSLESRAKKITARAIKIRKLFHKIL